MNITEEFNNYCEFTMMGIIENWLLPENRGKSALQIAQESNVDVRHVHRAYGEYRSIKSVEKV